MPPSIEVLEGIFREVLGLGPEEDPKAIERETDERWDSLRHVLLVSAIESELGVSFSVAESLDIKSLQEAEALLSGRRPAE